MQEWIDTVAGGFATWLILPLIGTGVYLTWRLRLVQIFHFGHSWKVIAGVYDRPGDTGDVNHLQALSAALSATIGIGNIAGVATAIHFGGPGAMFWMWVTAALGMATKFSEATLAMVFRMEHKDGSVSGGPMYYIEKGLGKGWKPLAILFACATITSSFGTGNAIQAFTVADSMRADFGIPPWITGLVIATLVALVILGGIKRIGVVASRLVPFMAFVYVTSCVIVCILNIDQIPATFAYIMRDAFTAQGALGGFAGSTFFMGVLWGVRRGIYSNEAGQGSAPIAHAAAKTDEPVREGTVAMIGPFLDTLVICSLTGLTIITSGAWNSTFENSIPANAPIVVRQETVLQPGGKIAPEDRFSGNLTIRDGQPRQPVRFVYREGFVDESSFVTPDSTHALALIAEASLEVKDGRISSLRGPDQEDLLAAGAMINGATLLNGSVLTSAAFQTAFYDNFGYPWGRVGRYMVTVGVLLFAISTVISWSYYGDRAIVYLVGQRGVRIYRWIYVVIVFIGSNLALGVVWSFGDIALSIMATPNLLALLLLSPRLVKFKQDYFSRKHVEFRKAHWLKK